MPRGFSVWPRVQVGRLLKYRGLPDVGRCKTRLSRTSPRVARETIPDERRKRKTACFGVRKTDTRSPAAALKVHRPGSIADSLFIKRAQIPTSGAPDAERTASAICGKGGLQREEHCGEGVQLGERSPAPLKKEYNDGWEISRMHVAETCDHSRKKSDSYACVGARCTAAPEKRTRLDAGVDHE